MLVLVVFATLLCVVLAARSWLRRDPNPIPSLPGQLPIIGHSLKFMGGRKRLLKFLLDMQIGSLQAGGVSKFLLGPHINYVITDPEDSLTLSNACFENTYVNYFAKDFVNNGLLLAHTPVWKAHRKLLNPSFGQQVINTYLDEMNAQAQRVVSQLASKVGKEPFDVRKYFINFTLSSITRTSIGLNEEDRAAIDVDYANAIDELIIIYSDRLQKVWLHLSCIYKWTAMKFKENQLINKLNSIVDPIILKRKSEFQKNKGSSDTTSGKYKSVLDRMLQLADEQKAFTDDDIREHLNTFVAAAYDTTSTALTIIMLVIGEKQNIQDKIFNELQEQLPQDVESFDKNDLQKLVYLEAVIKETLRLYPVVPVIGRTVDIDVKLKNHTLRSGTTCYIGLYGLLRHPMWGADADEFRPERWLDPSTVPDHPSLKADFSVGKRNCIGKLYGMTIMKIVLAHILRRYHVTGTISNVVCEFHILAKPVEGHLIKLTSRT